MVSPLVWSIFIGQNADLTSGRDCSAKSAIVPIFWWSHRGHYKRYALYLDVRHEESVWETKGNKRQQKDGRETFIIHHHSRHPACLPTYLPTYLPSTVEPACKVSVLSNENWPYKRADHTSGQCTEGYYGTRLGLGCCWMFFHICLRPFTWMRTDRLI